MCFIFKFGKYYLVTLLSEWLELGDFLVLDTALTNKTESQKLLNLCVQFAKRFESLFFTYDCVPISMPLGLWLAKRQFSAICCEMEESFLSNYKPKTILETIKMWLFGSEAERQCKANPNIIKGIQFHLSVFYNEPKLMSRLLPKCEHLQEIRVYYKETLRSRSECVHLGYDFEKNVTLHASFVDMVRQCRNLRRIQIGCDIMTVKLMTALVVWCRQLESMEIFLDANNNREQYFLAFHGALQMTQMLVQTASPLLWRSLLWYRGSALRHLTLVEMGLKCETLSMLPPTLTDLRLARVTLDGSLLCSLPRLRRLYLHDSNLFPTTVITALLEGNHLYFAKLYDVVPLRLLAGKKPVTSLVELDLTYAPDLDDSTLEIVGTCCPALRALTMQFCRKITDMGVRNIIVNGRLVSLNMRGTELTGITLFNLHTFCRGFKYFTLLHNHISAAELLDFVRNCPSLRYLNVFSKDVNFGSKLRQINPRLKWKPY